MGIVEKQATQNTLFSYLGAAIGFVITTWSAHLLSPAENGVIGLLVSYAALFSQFANLGFTSVTVRFFPYFRDKDKGHNGFLFYALLISMVGFILCWVAFLFMKPQLVASNQQKSELFVTYLFYLMPLTLFTVFFNIFDSYLRACYSSVIGPFTKDFLLRISILLLLFAFWMKLIDFRLFILLYIIFTCLPTLILMGHIIRQNEWHIKPVRGFVSKELRREMLNLGFYSILAGGAGAVVINIDSIMVNQFLGEAQAGIYRIAFNFGVIILIPARSLYRITSSIVAENFKTGNIAAIHKLYAQSCNTQLAIGLLLFIGIVANIDNIMALLPPSFASARNVILILTAGGLVEMATGINQVIISSSQYYRYETYFVFIVVGVTVLCNYLLIPAYGIMGSALATTITLTVSNVLRFSFLRLRFGMQPYNRNTLKLLLIGIVALLPGLLIPTLPHFIIDIAIRSAIVGGIFLLAALKTDAMPELNNKIRKNLIRFGIRL